MKRVSLRLRLSLLVGILTGGAVLLFALVFYVGLQSNLLQSVDERLQDRSQLVADALREAGSHVDTTTNLPALPPLAEFDAPGIYVELIGPDGSVRASSPNLGSDRLPVHPVLVQTAIGGQPAAETVTAGGDEEVRLLATPILLAGAPNAVLLVAESLEPLQRTLAQARTLLFAVGLGALLLATVGALVLTGRALAPVARLTRSAADIAATGRYEQRVPTPRREDEIGQLGKTINELIATLEKAIEQQRQFLADTSHELRSPLTVVLANLDLLRRDLDHEERDISVAEAIAETQRMRRLVNDLLLLAQADSAQVIAHAPVRFDYIVVESVAAASRRSPEHRVQVAPGPAVVVSGDRERLTQVVRNLVENALLHTPAGTTVGVSWDCADAHVRLVVEDDGAGIAPEHLARIWERFYRIDKARSRSLGGTGLGLAIVKYITEAHGGSVDVTSRPGHGTRFSVTLPLASHLPVADDFALASLSS